MQAPKLSILIPAFEYADGLRRILPIVSQECTSSVEILIFDDSSSDEVVHVVREWKRSFQHIIYRRNSPSLGASANWNSLLDYAIGEYCLLMHHDEFPIGDNWINHVLEELKKEPSADVLIMDCCLVTENGEIVRRHLPYLISTWIIRNAPAYFFRRNPIGPVSSLIVRRNMFPRFDESLRWLVDVDLYYRLRMSKSKWRICKNIQIGSILGRKDSITCKLGNQIQRIKKIELIYLRQKYPDASTWLKPERYFFIFGIEALVWLLMRLTTIIYVKASILYGRFCLR